jgi:alkanesulfonate monooxygenase SsuD/methylene tetrahydromethanopterin reductase-like flavin-dependent oxidoreductase (luciferase family)
VLDDRASGQYARPDGIRALNHSDAHYSVTGPLNLPRGHFVTAGTPEQIADLIEDWFRDGAADGFNLMPPVLPSMLEVFIAEVVPLLQKRGLFRTGYAGETLRAHYGLARPEVVF